MERDQATERERQFNNSITDETQLLTLIYSRELAVYAKKEGAITRDNRRHTLGTVHSKLNINCTRQCSLQSPYNPPAALHPTDLYIHSKYN